MPIFRVVTDVLATLPSAGGFRSQESTTNSYLFSDSKVFLASGFLKSSSSYTIPNLKVGLQKSPARGLIAKGLGNSGGDAAPVAPLQFISPVGQLLGQILQTHPHLVPATIDQQLENLQVERVAQVKDGQTSPQDLLYKRIAEVKEKERQRTLEEIIYCLIVQKFLDKDISMIPKVASESDATGRMDFWPNQEQKLESVHSSEAFEMIQSHLSLVLGERVFGPLNSIVQISKFNLGKLYAASIIYGYFLRRVDQRFQLERSMNTLPKNLMSEEHLKLGEPSPLNQPWGPAHVITPDDSDGRGLHDLGKSYQLRSYVMCFDADTLQKYATIRSPEAISLIEKQTQALFGNPEIRNSDDGSLHTSNHGVMSLTFSGLIMLVLEAVAFGSFLWDAEGYVESKYHFLKS